MYSPQSSSTRPVRSVVGPICEQLARSRQNKHESAPRNPRVLTYSHKVPLQDPVLGGLLTCIGQLWAAPTVRLPLTPTSFTSLPYAQPSQREKDDIYCVSRGTVLQACCRISDSGGGPKAAWQNKSPC